MSYLSKYGVARHIYIPLRKAGSNNHAVSADWTPAAGDVKISKDGGAAANVTNLPTAIAMGNSAIWDFSLTATEMQAAQVVVTVADSATKAVEDDGFMLETHGNASAQFQIDLADGVRAGLTALPNAAAEAAGGLYTRGTGAGQINQPANGMVDTNTVRWLGTAAATPTVAGVPEVDITHIAGIIAGTAASGMIPADIKAVDGDTTVDTTLKNWLLADVSATADSGTTTSMVDTQRTEADTDYWKGAKIVFDSGPNSGIGRRVTAFDPATDTMTFRAFPQAVASGHNYHMEADDGVDLVEIDGSEPPAQALARSTKAIVRGSVGAASTTTSIVTSSLDPAAAVTDQFKGRIVTFDRLTTTTNLRGQATDITANTSGGVLTVSALSTAPVSGDTFVIT